MYRVDYSPELKPQPNNHIVACGDDGYVRNARVNGYWLVVDPMRGAGYAAKVEAKREKRRQGREKQAQASRSYLFQPATAQHTVKAAKTRKTSGGKQTMHSRQKFMQANIMADAADAGLPMTGELIQPLRGREWVSEFWVPLAQAGITGILVAAGTGIVLAVSSELLDTVRAGLVEFAVIGGAGWLWQTIRNFRRHAPMDAFVEALPVGVAVGGATAVYYLVVTGNWFTVGWGAAISGVMGFAGLAAQWFGFLGKSDDLLYAVERVLNTDLDGDGYEGEPPVEPNGVRAIPFNRGEDSGAVEVDNSLPVDSHVWQAFAVAVLVHKCTISKNAITKLTSEKGWKWRKISQPAYGAIYRYCEKNRYIDTDGTTGSNTLSAKGWDELSRWLPQNISPNLPHPTL